MAYPENQLNIIRDAIKQDNPEAAVDASIVLLAEFLSDVRKIANAVENTDFIARQAMDVYNGRYR